MKKLVVAVGAVALVSSFAFAADVLWVGKDGVYDGNITNEFHWSTGAMPTAADSAYVGANLGRDFTVSFTPEELVFPARRLGFGVYAGHTVTVNGRGATLKTAAMPDGATYAGTPFEIYNRGWNDQIVKYQVSSATPNPNLGPVYELTDFAFTVSSQEATDAKVEFTAGTYNFLTPCGREWTSLPGRPILYMLDFNNNNYAMKKGEVVFGPGTSLVAPMLGVTGNAETNVLRFTGAGTHTADTLGIPCRSDAQNINETRTVTDIVVEDGASLTVAQYLNLLDCVQSTNRVARLIARANGSISLKDVNPAYGEVSLIADGGTLAFDGGNQDFNDVASRAKYKQASLEARNGGTVRVNQQNSGAGLYWGAGVSATSKDIGKARVDFDHATLDIRPAARMNVYNGMATFKDSTIRNEGVLNFASRDNYKDLDVVIDGTTITNAPGSTLTFGTDAQAGHLIITNSTLDLNSQVWFKRFPVTDIYDTNIRLLSGGSFQAGGSSYFEPSVINLHSGTMTTHRSTDYNGYIGSDGNGVAIVNVYGGYWEFGMLFIAQTYVPPAGEQRETSLNIYGGEVYVKCAGNGDAVGLTIGENETRKNARIRLMGGVLRSYTTVAKAGVTFFEADGGTIAPPPNYPTPYLLHGFTHAMVGPKGLTVDNAGATDVTVTQDKFVDMDDADGKGCILSKGSGLTRFTGDLSGVSYLVSQEGTLDLTQLAVNAETGLSLGSLVSTNGAAVKLSLGQTLQAGGTVVLDAGKFVFDESVVADTAYDLVHYATAVSDETLDALAAGKVVLNASATPAGTVAVFEQVEDVTNGGYILRLTCRAPQVAKTITVSQGDVVNDESCVFSLYDRLVADVAESASLTLEGSNRFGAIDKTGEGVLELSGLGGRYLGGLNLLGGAVVLGDESGVVGAAESTTILSNGVLKITGPAGGVTLPGAFKIAATTSNEVVIIDNEVDVTMAAPSGTPASLHTANPADEYSGSFIKRGAGTLTWEVTGASVLPGGLGNTFYGGTFWPYTNPDERCEPFVFDETSGVLKSGSHPAFTVYEGCLRLVGKGTGAKLSTSGVVSLGMAGRMGSVQPGLILDNVTLAYTYWGNRWMMAPGIYSYSETDPGFITDPYLVLTNRATLSAYAFYLNRLARSDGALKSTVSAYDGSTFTCTVFSPNRCSYDGKAISRSEISFTDSTFRIGNDSGGGSLEMFQPFTMNFDHSVFAGNSNPTTAIAAYLRIRPEDGVSGCPLAYGTFNFRNGSEFRCREVLYYADAAAPVAFNFDDSAWIPGVDDFSFAWDDPTKIAITATGAGLKLPVPAEKTWTLAQPILGRGPVVNDGAGTLKLAAGFDRMSGAVRAEAGATVDLDGAAHKIFIAGPGTFANGSIAAGGGLYLPVDDAFNVGPMPTLSNVTLPAMTRVNIARDDNPLVAPYQPIALFTYEGEAPDVSKWRLVGTGVQGLGGAFEAKDGVVTVTPVSKGLSYILR